MKKTNTLLEKIRQKRELKKFIRTDLLPNIVVSPERLNQNDYHIKWLEYLGFKDIKLENNFITCKFPKGWKKIPTYLSSNFVYLVDNKNRKRASIFFNYFYKSEEENAELLKPYISSYITWLPRYTTAIRREVEFPLGKNYNNKNLEKYYNSKLFGVIIDNSTSKILFKTSKKSIGVKYGNDLRLYSEHEKNLKEALFSEINEYLLQKFPDANNINAYWD